MQALVLQHQRIANHDATHAGVFFGKLQQQRDDAARLLRACTFAVGDLANQTNHRLVHEVDQPFEHLGLAGEVTVQGRFAHADFGGQACGGDALGTGLLEHGHQGLQYLQPAFTGAWPFACRRRVLVALVL